MDILFIFLIYCDLFPLVYSIFICCVVINEHHPGKIKDVAIKTVWTRSEESECFESRTSLEN